MPEAFNRNELGARNKSCCFFSCCKRQKRIFRAMDYQRRRTQLS